MDGLLILDKPQGMTSHDVVARGRRVLQTKQIGHAGTLDPMATGVLVLCIGKATRLSEYLLGEDKTYDGVITLGARTNTDDAEGQVVQTRPVPQITAERLAQLRAAFTGEISQVPPQFSAIKRDGQRAYALARKGEAVDLAARRMTIHVLQLEPISADELRIHVRCSAGTYIRSLARDMGEMLGCGGHLSALRRVQAGAFSVDGALPLNQLEAWQQHLLPMDAAVPHFAALNLDEAQVRDISMGRVLDVGGGESGVPPGTGLCRLYSPQHALVAIGECDGRFIKPVKVFAAT